MPYKDPQVAKQKARERYAQVKDDPEFQRKRREYAEKNKRNKREYDTARRQNLPSGYRTAINQRYWAKLKNDPVKKARKYATHRKYSTNNHQAILRIRLRSRVQSALRNQNLIKSEETIELLGASIPFVMKVIESKFKAGMSWANRSLWEIDHIRAVSKFDLTVHEERLKAFHYSNLQPLWTEENRQKSNSESWIDPYESFENLNGVSSLFD